MDVGAWASVLAALRWAARWGSQTVPHVARLPSSCRESAVHALVTCVGGNATFRSEFRPEPRDFFSRLKLAFEKYHYAVITRAKVTISKTVALFQVQLVETRINTQSLWSFDGEDSSGIFIEFLVVVAPSRYRLQATSCRCIGWKARWSGLPVVAVQRAYAALLELPPASDLGDGSGPELHELLAEVRLHRDFWYFADAKKACGKKSVPGFIS
ncbi:hypothetical protein AK812_SmicGene25152 [Symbiodinium microadriaticum]|uniref:Uncharacterized protein n=1 Tax=Symbiodinium microadriaticum TaxID=2951 RepID=A0A1Q9DCV2_SYMMI|nr:hypothetical protein AK812_SmicGene25152 [Symbiodinium microadriaticum]